MQFWTFVTCVAFLATLTNCEEASEVTQRAAASANTQFALDLLQKLSTGDNKNVFFSPMSISAAIAMTSLGARGTTLSEINQAFHFDQVYNTSTDPKALHEVFKKIITLYGQDNGNYSLSLANRLFGKKGFEILQEFLQDTEDYYKATLQQLDFNGEAEGIINQWVEQQTNDKIKDLFKPNSLPPETVLVLVNAIYFKGNWKIKFDERDTIDKDFHTTATETKSVKMMQMTKDFNYYQDNEMHVQVLEMPYAGNDLSMIVILPRQGEIQNLISQLTAAKLESLISNLSSKKVNVKFPRFQLETEYSLKETLQLLGINQLFDNRANLTGISPNKTEVSQVVHKTFVDVNEEGTEAAAATGIQIIPVSLPLPPPLQIDFIADHPFVFVLCDKRRDGGHALFAGTMYRP